MNIKEQYNILYKIYKNRLLTLGKDKYPAGRYLVKTSFNEIEYDIETCGVYPWGTGYIESCNDNDLQHILIELISTLCKNVKVIDVISTATPNKVMITSKFMITSKIGCPIGVTKI